MLGIGQKEPGHPKQSEDNIQPRVNITTESKALDVSFQKDITDADYLKIALNMAFCGWRLETDTEKKTLLGIEVIKLKENYTIDLHGRLMNEACANFLFASIMPLISKIMSTSNLSEIQIYNLWNGKLMSLEFALLDSYYVEPKVEIQNIFDPTIWIKTNPYELKINRGGDIITLLATFSGITMKAHKGFTLKELAETFITSLSTTNKPTGLEERRGMLDKLFKIGR